MGPASWQHREMILGWLLYSLHLRAPKIFACRMAWFLVPARWHYREQYFNRLTENNMNTEQFSFLFILDLFKSWWICFVLFTSQAIWFVLTKSQGIWFEIMICVHIILFWSNDLPTSWSDKRNGLLLSESQGIWFEIMIRVHIVFF